MKKKLSGVIIGCLVLAAAIWLWVARSPRRAADPTLPSPTLSSVSQPAAAAPTATATPATVGTTKEQRMSKTLEVLNDQSIEFYGKVIDQSGTPVAAVNVTGDVMVEKQWMNGYIEKHHTTTDADGLFSFKGLRGRDLSISLDSPGYEFKGGGHTLFKYSQLTEAKERHSPVPNNPIVFTMWKLRDAEPLVHINPGKLRLPVDGSQISVDLLTGKQVLSGGDLLIEFARTPANITRGQHFDWKLILRVPDGGGLVEIQDTYPNEAPADGYANSQVIEMLSNSPAWRSSTSRAYYVKIRDGKAYGRLNLRITADYQPPPTLLMLDGFVNPNASRNLQGANNSAISQTR